MSYFLKKSYPSKKGLYLQIYESFYIPGKGKRNHSHSVIGYASDLIAKGISDPIAYAQAKVDELNSNSSPSPEIGDFSTSKNLGYFLLKAMINKLDIDYTMKLMSSNKKFDFLLSDFVKSMIYAQVVNPGSKHKAFEKVLPNLVDSITFSYDQILDTINYIGNDYQKFIELFNHQINEVYKRDTSNIFFDCTNYYFEVDFPSQDKQYGPSKEERHLPIIGQALMLDSNQIPIAMSLYPGNESEKPLLRNTIEDMKSRFDINSKIVQIADKGLNCAKNIYAASIEAHDGYIFSKSFRGHSLPQKEKNWILLEDDDKNRWTSVYDSNNNIKYRYKECIDTFDYKFTDDNDNEIKFKVREKRIVTFSPSLARKQKIQINKQVEKAKAISSIKESKKSDYGQSIKYVDFNSVNNEGETVDIIASINQKAIDEDIDFAGYNLIVTSELDKSPQEIYEDYHGLWKIEESFRILKTYLEARPVYLQKKESIYGHFLICYLSLTVLRLLEIYEFNRVLSTDQIVSFIRDFNVTKSFDNTYINNASKSSTIYNIKQHLGLSKITNLYLKEKDIKNILDAEL